jgi:oligopeptide/dipeptide ABC transporter ATP-binding protein
MSEPLLSVEDLRVAYPLRRDKPWRARQHVRAVDGVSLRIDAGETVALVGESGCGKSTLGRAVLQLAPATGGRVTLGGRDLSRLDRRELRRMRADMQMVFQDSLAAMNPRHRVARVVAEPLRVHGACSAGEVGARVEELLGDVNLPPSLAQRYPHELSGGQRQRVGIARALATRPALIVADEPVSALDVSVQAQIVNLLNVLQERHALSFLFISHDLAVVRHLAHRIAVMYLGQIVEQGPARELLRAPRHPYTQALLSAVPALGRAPDQARPPGPAGEPPSPLAPPPGCRFYPRCPHARARCREEQPALRSLGDGHDVACHFAEEIAAHGRPAGP